MRLAYTTPSGQYYTLYKDMLSQIHLLIVGATGSGKSVIINSILTTALYDGPAEVEFILIDPKRVELMEYKHLPHTIAYASEPDEIVSSLEHALDIADQRYAVMQSKGLKKYDGGHIYVVIDELADLMTTNKRKVQPLIQRLAQIGRASNVHIIAATQCPLSSVIPTAIKVNFDSRVGLRTRSAQDSRNILGMKGCELLPQYGQGYYMTPARIQLYHIPMYKDDTRVQLINYWISTKPKIKFFEHFYSKLGGIYNRIKKDNARRIK